MSGSTFPEPAVFSADDIRVGLTARFDHAITEADVYAFARLSGDANPLHVDAAYAGGTNYGGRIVHGAYQVGLASALLGMHLPGRHVVLGSVSARFPAPLYFPCHVTVSGEITGWNAAARSGTLRVTVLDRASGAPTAEIQTIFALHEERHRPSARTAAAARASVDATRAVVLVTGASGGIGAELVTALAGEYSVIAMARRNPVPGIEAHAHVVPFAADLQDPSWHESLDQLLDGRGLYGVVHAAWPGHPQGSLLQVDPAVITQQLQFAALSTTELARLLFAQAPPAGETGGRLVVLGSVAGTHDPTLSAASYSLGKATLEHTVRLLAPELARRRVTVNVVSPSFIPAGMNRQATDRQQLKAAALVPMGRLCEPADVAGLVRYLLSPEASFVSGQVIGLTGAQL